MDQEPQVLDLTGLKCPLPALYARRWLERAGPGRRVVVLTDDPMAVIDLPHMCHQEGYCVEAISREGERARIVLLRPAFSRPASA
jgi:tRNA 2-thiouridine synthesizing protein A